MIKKVFITGVSRGLGKELFILFASKGYYVYGTIRKESQLEIFSKMYPDNSKIILADLSKDTTIKSLQDSVGLDPIDLLINNAGIGGTTFSIENTESDEIMSLFNIHCLGVFRTTKALAVNLLKSSRPMIINLNSRFGSITRQSNGTYAVLQVSYSYRIAKAAQNMLTNCLRKEFRERLEVISVHPGKMKTAIASKDADIDPKDTAQRIFHHYENGTLKEVNGILELDKEIIEW